MYGRAGSPPFALVDDIEGARVPSGVRVFDAHVHLFPPKLFDAIWRWFGKHAWPVRYRLYAEDVIQFLLARGVQRFCGLAYSHSPGLARVLNEHMAELGRAHSQLVPLATVLPGEPDARAILHDAFSRLGLRGVKLHCHVQKLAADDARLDEIYALASDAGVPVIIHAGNRPDSAAYGIDTHALCPASAIERVLQRHPRLTLIVPHLGMDELDEYRALLEQYEHLWLDTTMAIGEYFPVAVPEALYPRLAHRLLYGTDFPNLPYAWDRELNLVMKTLPEGDARQRMLWANAAQLFDG